MIVVWGSYGLNKTFSDLPAVDFCGFCHFHGRMECVTTARLAHFCFIPLFVFDRKYFLVCPNCGNVIRISKEVFKAIKKGSYVPPPKNESLHVLDKREIFEKQVTQEAVAVINKHSKQLGDPEKQEASKEKIRTHFRKKYGGNEMAMRIIENLISPNIEDPFRTDDLNAVQP